MVDLARRRLFLRKTVEDSAIIMPWVKSAGTFTDECTRCGKCVSVCETSVIINGDGGFPTVDFSRGECTFCYQCADVCPEPIFLPQSSSPWQIKADIKKNCLAYQNVECRSCGEICDTMAIQFKLQLNRVAQPVINIDDCSGCGACVSVCPTASIHVSNTI
ncbi:MAG: ferredoxin-type protein NapF [Vibrio sp.]|uniref:ferredoxin-type protein NapF n=1 Tax=Vibrio sp. TaxID=678 RepID=UPI003A837ECA